VNISHFLYLKLFPKSECYIRRYKHFEVKKEKIIVKFLQESTRNNFLRITESGLALVPRG
jgi:hypothetical protein